MGLVEGLTFTPESGAQCGYDSPICMLRMPPGLSLHCPVWAGVKSKLRPWTLIWFCMTGTTHTESCPRCPELGAHWVTQLG